MSRKVLRLVPPPKAGKRARPDVVRALRTALRWADEGKVRAACFVLVMENGETATACEGASGFAESVGALEILKDNLLRRGLSRARDGE